VKLLFDENLSPRLPELLREAFPGSSHVRSVGLLGADDGRVWNHARDQGFVIVSKDNDFRQRSFLYGAPPKIIWLRAGNAGTAAIDALLRREQPRIVAFERNTDESLLVLSLDDGAA
jgi:predicted nuclease of predicted toxin-antitoxin system